MLFITDARMESRSRGVSATRGGNVTPTGAIGAPAIDAGVDAEAPAVGPRTSFAPRPRAAALSARAGEGAMTGGVMTTGAGGDTTDTSTRWGVSSGTMVVGRAARGARMFGRTGCSLRAADGG